MRHSNQNVKTGSAVHAATLFVLMLLVNFLSHAAFAATAQQDTTAAAPSVSPREIKQAKREQRRNRKHRSFKEVAGSIDPNVDLNAQVGGRNARVGLGYNYSVDPSYQSGLYTRTDRWHPQASIQLIPGLKAVPGAEVVVIRQFKSKSDALKAKPLMKLGSLPFTAERALDMDPGSIIMVPVRLEVFEGAEGSTQLAGPLSVSGRAGHVDRGTYQIQAQRLEGNKVRLRVLATRHHAFEAEASLRMGVLPFGKKIASASKNQGSRSLLSSEYVFDLAKPETRKAYDELFKPDRLRPRADMANPFMSTQKLETNMQEGLAPLQQILAEDANLPVNQRRIVQAFNGK
ncbi:MAG: hypothetical protein EOP05_13920, partial [Proteobacteria bacterium]